jgi:hypothetical protein
MEELQLEKGNSDQLEGIDKIANMENIHYIRRTDL